MGRGPKNFQNNDIQNQKISNKHGGDYQGLEITSIHPSPTYHNKNEIRGWVFEIREEKMKILEKIGVGV